MTETLNQPSTTTSLRKSSSLVVDQELKTRLRQFTSEGTNAFISYSTRLGSDSNPSGTVADISHMQVWKGDESARRTYVEKILDKYRGQEGCRIESYGDPNKPDKFLVFIEEPENYSPRQGLERLLEVQQIPLDSFPYGTDLETYRNLLRVRERELMDGEEGSWFVQVAEGDLSPDDVPGMMEQTGFSNVWGWKNENDRFIANGPGGVPFDMLSLARDPETGRMATDKWKFFTQGKLRNRSIIELCIAADTGECGGGNEKDRAVNEQKINSNGFLKQHYMSTLFLGSIDNENDKCQHCRKLILDKKRGCNCRSHVESEAD